MVLRSACIRSRVDDIVPPHHMFQLRHECGHVHLLENLTIHVQDGKQVFLMFLFALIICKQMPLPHLLTPTYLPHPPTLLPTLPTHLPHIADLMHQSSLSITHSTHWHLQQSFLFIAYHKAQVKNAPPI